MIFSSQKQSVRILHTGDLHLDSPFAGLDISRAERSVKQTVAGLTALAPDHSAVVGTNVAAKAALNERLNDLVHIE